MDVNKILVSNKMSLGKNGFKYFIGHIDLYAYSFQKWVHVEKILIKLNVCFFFIKDEKLFEKYTKIWKKSQQIFTIKKYQKKILNITVDQ